MAKPSDGASGWSKQVVQVRLVSDGVEFMVMSLGIEGVGRNSHPLPGVHKKARLCFSVHRLVRTGNPQRAHIRSGYPPL